MISGRASLPPPQLLHPRLSAPQEQESETVRGASFGTERKSRNGKKRFIRKHAPHTHQVYKSPTFSFQHHQLSVEEITYSIYRVLSAALLLNTNILNKKEVNPLQKENNEQPGWKRPQGSIRVLASQHQLVLHKSKCSEW